MPQDATAPLRSQPQPEPWLRGTLTEFPSEQRAVLHALQLAREDIALWCEPLTEMELAALPHGLPPVAFHLRHVAGSLDRLLTYAEDGQLSQEQKQQLDTEMASPVNREELLADFERGLSHAEARIRAIETKLWPQARGVGRKQLPTTVGGLMVHCADHTQRHIGQAVTTAKVLLALRKNS